MAEEILDSASPFWLRLYGKWVRLQGVMPVVEQSSQRGFSELVTVDGFRYEQRSPVGPRSWSFDYRWGTAAATAALESAAYDYNFNDPSMRTLLLDTDAAKVNMVPPDLVTRWSNSAATSGPLVYNVGEPDGLPMFLPTYDGGPDPAGGISVDIPVRGGVTYTAAVWTSNTNAGASVLVVTGAASATGGGAPGATPANPHLSVVTFTPAADGTINVAVQIGFTAGLMVYEGDCPPTSYRAGQRTPCAVSVHDPARTHNLMHGWGRCDPCALPREHTSWVLREVGMDATTPMDVGVTS